MRLLIPLGACLAVLSGCGGGGAKSSTSGSGATAPPPASTGASTPAPGGTATASASVSGNTVSASAGGVTATLIAGTHAPKAASVWPLRFTVTRGGRPERAAVSYEYLFSGQVVARRDHYTFDGSFHDTFVWPSTAVGYPLTFRAVITAPGATIDLDYPVQVSG